MNQKATPKKRPGANLTPEEYEEWIKGFEVPHTTDECHTPVPLYNALLTYFLKKYNLKDKNIIRPFYPGGDFENYPYSEGDVVFDNPPFSLTARIIRFYTSQNIPFIIFLPAQTCLHYAHLCTLIIPREQMTFSNGARVAVAFATNLTPEIVAESDPELEEVLKKVEKERAQKKARPSYDYPPETLSFSKIATFSNAGVPYKLERTNYLIFIKKLNGRELFAGRVVITDSEAEKVKELKEKAEVLKAEKLKKEKTKINLTFSEEQKEEIEKLKKEKEHGKY